MELPELPCQCLPVRACVLQPRLAIQASSPATTGFRRRSVEDLSRFPGCHGTA